MEKFSKKFDEIQKKKIFEKESKFNIENLEIEKDVKDDCQKFKNDFKNDVEII